MRVQGLCDDRRRKKTDEIWNSNRPRARSLAGRRWQRRERVRRLAHKFIHPILFKKRSLRKERGKFFRIWLLLITHRRTVWGCCEMGGRGPFLFLFFARAFWRAAAGVKAGPAATTTLLLAIQGLCSSAFFCFPAADTDPSTRLTRVSQWIPNAKIFIKTQENTQLGSVRTWVERFLILFKCQWRHPLSPFPEWLFSILFRFFFWNFVFPAQLMTT